MATPMPVAHIERTAGYVNWIRDYVKNLGVANASTAIKNNLKALDVRLTYKFAGYTDKKYIELLAEQNSPTSVNDQHCYSRRELQFRTL
jgi:hypothetical protein